MTTPVTAATTIAPVYLARLQSTQATAYRLMQKLDGTLILQGAFGWTEGLNGGHEWIDIPTIIEKEHGIV